MINRRELITKYNPVQDKPGYMSPFTVGNGSLGYTADVTGMQTLYDEHVLSGVPLLTMSEWGWHTIPADTKTGRYTLDDLVMTEYDAPKGKVRYPVEKTAGNEEVYDWLRKNPHRYDLARIGLYYKDQPIVSGMLEGISQTLDLYSGILHSSFTLDGTQVTITTVCHREQDTLGFRIESDLVADGSLTACIALPYGAADITGASWADTDRHETKVLRGEEGGLLIQNKCDADLCYVDIRAESGAVFHPEKPHCFTGGGSGRLLTFTVSFSETADVRSCDFSVCMDASRSGWEQFWEQGGMVSFEGSTDPRADELQRRILLSLYLSAVNSANSMPPQETGLTVNSWYGKAHLEMHLWHLAWLPLWGRGDLLRKSLSWYKRILPRAVENAGRNGYKGAKWPKMVGPKGVDCPSGIAPLLIWQQPHIIYMLELTYQCQADWELLKEYWEVVRQSADYMADLVVYNEEKQCYELCAPLIPAQERHRPQDTKNPVFETEYWRFGLKIAADWARRLDREVPEKWEHVAAHMAGPALIDGLYPAHENCPDTFTRYAEDHPSMTAALGLLPRDRIDPAAMRRTLDKIYKVWDFESLWGWDFAMMAMTETRLGNPEAALDILLYQTGKNCYETSGNNRQVQRKDLPLYLPGNGSLLLAAALMAAGYEGCVAAHPGFPDDGSWKVACEGIHPFPY